MDETLLSVPTMTCRHCVRAISAEVQDLVGVQAVEADVTARTVRVHGTSPPEALRSAIAAAGHEAEVVARSRRSREPEGGHLP